DDLDLLISISLAPFMASNGGKLGEPRVETRNMGTEEEPIWEKRVRWDQPTISKTRYPGYVLVPDGSGALIRFSDYEASLNGYTGTVYGQDVSQNQTQYTRETNMVPVKQPVMPLFGVSYGDGTQAAFISYTTKGAEYMQIYARPRNSADSYNLTDYQIAHTRYLYNRLYTQVYNQSGAGYQSLFEERNHFDIYQQFDFLAGDGSSLANPYSADYVGMARKYRDHLIQTGVLVPKSNEEVNVPIRIDFLMSDAKKSLVGTEDVVVTNIYQVRDILTDLQNNGVYNINSGLLGYQKGGVTLGRKNEPEWSDSIGSKNAFQSVVNELKEQGIDVSLYQNYTTLYEENNLLI